MKFTSKYLVRIGVIIEYIWLGVICADMVDFSRPGHIYNIISHSVTLALLPGTQTICTNNIESHNIYTWERQMISIYNSYYNHNSHLHYNNNNNDFT